MNQEEYSQRRTQLISINIGVASLALAVSILSFGVGIIFAIILVVTWIILFYTVPPIKNYFKDINIFSSTMKKTFNKCGCYK